MFLKEFKDLRRKRGRLLGLPDQLNYAIPIDDYTIAMKDGAFLSAFDCAGLDLNSASVEELDAHRAQANRALARLDDGFMYNIDLIRHPSVDYPSRTFPDPISATLDREREIQYSAEGQHFETRCILTITYRPPADAQTRIAGVFLTGTPRRTDWRRQLDWFKQRLREFEDAISSVWKLTSLNMPALLSYLASCISGRMSEVAAPRTPTYLDAVLGNQDLIAGFKPRIGGRHIRVIALAGFPPFSYSEMAAFLSELPICYRYSTRGIPVGPRTAISQLTVYRRNWFQKRLGLRGVISEHFGSGAGAAFQNRHALRMAADADEAITEAEGGAVRYCYVTPKVIITEDRADVADENAQLVFKVCQNTGFDPRIETINSVEAWLASLPGHGWYDVRRPLVNTQNLADILPLTSIWPGLATNPCPYYPKSTPALCYGATTGSTPFRLSLHIGDTGHTGIYGPTGSGKSVALGAIAANFRAVPDGQVFFFDKGYSAYVLTKALGGQHLDLGEDEVPLCPLARIDDETDRMKLQGLLEDWLEVHGVRLVPNQRKALWRGLTLVAEGPAEQRTISNLVTQVQDNVVRDGLGAFSLAGPLGRFVDAESDVLLEGRFVTFELETLMAMGPKVVVPVATYLFHRIDQRLDGRPTLIILDEAWIMLTNSVFGAKIEEWLRTLRKKNAAVVLATQSLSEIANSPHRDVILESCPTKLYLPNPEAKNSATREMYRRFGLSDRQIDIVSEAIPKRHYYYVSPLGRRLFQFSLGPAALAFIGAGSKDDILATRRMSQQHGERWTVEWLRARGLHDWAEYLDRLNRHVESPTDALLSLNGILPFDTNGEVHQREIHQ
jgi:type IV secretion system protein VirB4